MNSEAMIGKIEELKSVKQELLAEIRKVIVGQDDVVEKVLMGLFANGHMLIEGVPGLAKTLLISTIAKALNLSFGRIQFTPDLMPSDITGSDILVSLSG
ncbi:MAG TPA: AAA family ATPase, partial [Candidatus Syntrophosphaera sp.]|nr:AAA family ATPase [Candidatus Syntrophosphaera sp.]